MKKIVCVFGFVIFTVNVLFSQGSLPQDYYNKDIQQSQVTIVKVFLEELKKGNKAKAAEYIDKDNISLNKLDSLKNVLSDKKIENVFGPITYLDGYNIYSVYYKKDGSMVFKMSFFFKEGIDDKIIRQITIVINKAKKQRKDSYAPPNSPQ